MDYISFTLQTSQTESKEALIYSKHKRQLFTESQSNRTPIKLKDYTLTEDKQKIVVNDMTFVSTPQPLEYAFQYAELQPVEEHPVSLIEVLNTKTEWDIVTVRGKLAQKNPPTKVGKNLLRLSTTTIVDGTTAVPIDLWEWNIDKIATGKSYIMNSLQVRVWSGRKKLSTTQRTVIRQVEDEELDSLEIEATSNNPGTESLQIKEFTALKKFERFQKCPKCSKKIPQTTSAPTVKCTKCGTMKANNSQVGFFITVTVETPDGKELSLLNWAMRY